jgi:acrylyl-CoA reductase (NADPH)
MAERWPPAVSPAAWIYPVRRRRDAWKWLEIDLNREKLATISREIGLSDVFEVAPEILSGQVRGRIVVKVG